MKTRIGVVVQAVVFLLTLTAIAAAQTPPVAVSGQSDQCFNQTGTVPLTCDIECVSSQPCEDYHVSVCSNTQIDEGIPGSANTLPGGTFAKTTCSQPTAPFGGSFTATGTWSGTNSVFFACVPSSLTGSTATFLISASDKTGQAATTTVTVPACIASGPQFTVQKSIGTKGIVNGHTRVGDIVQFDITVTNVGTESSGLQVTDEPPDGLEPSSVDSHGPPCDMTPMYINCHILSPGLPPGSSLTITMSFKVTKAGDLSNKAYVIFGPLPRIYSNAVTVEAKPPRGEPVRLGLPPLEPLPGR
jgi:uncharacterized repeat protein (TIGR01451 family)